jgi:toxin ParE1/3/4
VTARRVSFRPLAEDDLVELFSYIAERAGPRVAHGYLDRLERACFALADFPERGARGDRIRQGLRTVGFERRVTIAFEAGETEVVIVRLLYAGRDLERAIDDGSL